MAQAKRSAAEYATQNWIQKWRVEQRDESAPWLQGSMPTRMGMLRMMVQNDGSSKKAQSTSSARPMLTMIRMAIKIEWIQQP